MEKYKKERLRLSFGEYLKLLIQEPTLWIVVVCGIFLIILGK